MAHALAAFIRERTDDNRWRNADLVRESGLSRQVVSKYLNDKRETITKLPEKATMEGFAKAFGVSVDFLIGKGIESLGLGYTSGDFVNSVATARDQDLLAEIGRRLDERGEGHVDGSPAIKVPAPEPAKQSGSNVTQLSAHAPTVQGSKRVAKKRPSPRKPKSPE